MTPVNGHDRQKRPMAFRPLRKARNGQVAAGEVPGRQIAACLTAFMERCLVDQYSILPRAEGTPNQPLQQTGAAVGSRAAHSPLRGPGC